MSSELPTIPIIDTHQHLWDLDRIALAWLDDPPFDNLRRNFLPADYAQAATGLDIVKTVYMEVDARQADHPAEAEFILALCRAPGSRVAGVVLGGRPGDEAFPSWVKSFANEPYVKGFREVLFDRPAGYCLQENFIRGVRFLGEEGYSFDLETPVELLPDAIALANACPHTQFILDHCGHPDLKLRDDAPWKRLVAQIAERDNVVVKISGAFSGAELPPQARENLRLVIDHLMAAFGPQRVIFGSDWPVVSLASSFREWAESVWAAVRDRSPAEVEKLFHGNAVRIYRLG